MSRVGVTPKSAGRNAKRLAEGALDGRTAGQIAHVLIGELLAAGLRAPKPEDVFARVARHPSTQGAVVFRQAARQRLRTAVSIYFRLFSPPESWSFVGAEVPARGCRFDLVWRRPDRRVIVDELKSGRLETAEEQTELSRQVARLLAGGRSKYRGRFAGVRVCLLATPRLSYFAAPDGGKQPLEALQ